MKRSVSVRSPALRGKPDPGTVRIGATLSIPELLRGFGVDPAEVMAEAGIGPTTFNDPDEVVTFAARCRLVSRCAARTGCPHFGLLIGEHIGLHSLGLVGLLVRYSPDVGTALRSLVLHQHLHVRGAVSNLVVDGEWAAMTYGIVVPGIEAPDQTGDGAMAGIYNIVQALCGPEWKATEVRFAHRPPEDVGPFRRFFGVPLVFDAEQYAVVFPSKWLEHRMPEANPELERLLQQQIDALETRYGDQFPEKVSGVLRAALMTGHASEDQIAALFSMHSRTLSRRLAAFGTSFQALLDESRCAIAQQMLDGSAMSVSQITEILGYADASAFTRAFRRWTGNTPARWRAERRRDRRPPELTR